VRSFARCLIKCIKMREREREGGRSGSGKNKVISDFANGYCGLSESTKFLYLSIIKLYKITCMFLLVARARAHAHPHAHARAYRHDATHGHDTTRAHTHTSYIHTHTHIYAHTRGENKVHPGVFKNENVRRTLFIIIT